MCEKSSKTTCFSRLRLMHLESSEISESSKAITPVIRTSNPSFRLSSADLSVGPYPDSASSLFSRHHRRSVLSYDAVSRIGAFKGYPSISSRAIPGIQITLPVNRMRGFSENQPPGERDRFPPPEIFLQCSSGSGRISRTTFIAQRSPHIEQVSISPSRSCMRREHPKPRDPDG